MAIITRAQWGAAPARGAGNVLGNPVGVTQHWEGPSMGVWAHALCAAKVRGIQAFHQNTRGWTDIAYNLIVCPHGDAYVGRGADRGNAANGDASNLTRYSVCAMTGEGDPNTDALKAGILDAHGWLRAESGRALPTLDCHSDHVQTSCPGAVLRAWIKAGAPRPGIDPASPIPNLPPVPKPAPAPAVVVPAFPGTVRRGSRGAAVRAVQSRLAARGWRITVDGDFGPATDAVVRAFQKEKRLAVDGIVGPNTWRALWTAKVTN